TADQPNVMASKEAGTGLPPEGSVTRRTPVIDNPMSAPVASNDASRMRRNHGRRLSRTKEIKASVGHVEKEPPCISPQEWNVGQFMISKNQPKGDMRKNPNATATTI